MHLPSFFSTNGSSPVTPESFMKDNLKCSLMLPLKLIARVVCAQSCPPLCDPMDCSPPGSSAFGIFQARVLEWGAISYPRGSSQPRDQTCVFYVSPALAGVFFTTSTTWEDSPGKKLLKVYRTQAILKFPLRCIFYSVLLRD